MLWQRPVKLPQLLPHTTAVGCEARFTITAPDTTAVGKPYQFRMIGCEAQLSARTRLRISSISGWLSCSPAEAFEMFARYSVSRSSDDVAYCREAVRPKHIAIRAMLWDGGYGKTLLPA